MRTLLCLTALLLLAACGQPETASPASTSVPAVPTTAPAAATAAPTAPAKPADVPTANPASAGQPLVIYQVSGGIAGLDNQFMVYDDGSVKLTRRGTETGSGRLDPAELAALRAALVAPEVAQLAGSYGDPKQCCDMMQYRIEVPASGKIIETADGAALPPALESLMAQLNALQAKAGPAQ